MEITIDLATAAANHFSRRLQFETDCDDVALALASGANLAVIDARSPDAYAAGHLPGAVNLPRPFETEHIAGFGNADLVVYCWGPGCNGAVKAAHELAELGYTAREMLGGFEYWVREGHPVQGDRAEQIILAADTHGLVKLQGAISCLCS